MESHGDQAHYPGERHFGFMIMVCIVAICSKAVLLVVIVVTWNTLVGVNLLDMMRVELLIWSVG